MGLSSWTDSRPGTPSSCSVVALMDDPSKVSDSWLLYSSYSVILICTAEGKGEKEGYTHLNAEFQRNPERRKPSSVINAKKYRKTIQWKRLEISSRN